MRIELLGTSFSIQSDEDPAYLEKVLEYLKQKVDEVSSSVNTKDQVKIGILAALLISDELFKFKESQQPGQNLSPHEEDEVNEITQRLIRQIDDYIEQDSSENEEI